MKKIKKKIKSRRSAREIVKSFIDDDAVAAHKKEAVKLSGEERQRRLNWSCARNDATTKALQGMMTNDLYVPFLAAVIAERAVKIGEAIADRLYPPPAVAAPIEREHLERPIDVGPPIETFLPGGNSLQGQ